MKRTFDLLMTALVASFGGISELRAIDYQFQVENEYFDKHATDSKSLLIDLYTESKILLLGAANHRDMQHHLILIDLLKEVGTDLNLKYIVLEQFFENDEFYRKLSFNDVFDTLKTHRFASDHQRLITLCWSREWTWVYTHLFPVIQDINRRRPTDNPLIVRGLDGFGLDNSFGLTSPAEVKPVDCSFNNSRNQNTTDNIQNRELATAANFHAEVWSRLKDTDKAIVLYHQAHLYRHFESCRVLRTDAGAVSSINPRNWFSVLLRDHPEIEGQSRLVIFDEVNINHHPQGVLRFSRRQVERRPAQPWAIDVRGMRGIELERGENAWIFSPVSFNNEGMNYSDRYFYEIVDAVIWSPRAELDYKVGNVTDYMGNFCPKEGYDGYSAIPVGQRKP